jgi:hypothetical protein
MRFLLLPGVAWATAALLIDAPAPWGRWLAICYVMASLLLWLASFWRRRWLAGTAAGFLGVLLWWFSLQPSDSRSWQPDVDRTASADIAGGAVTIHNVRNFTYRTENDYQPQWETRHYDLDQLTGVDLFITYWGSPWIAHPILSFQFADGQRIAFSIEARKEMGEAYSALKGFFRQYELIYIVGDEGDLIRLRTTYRSGEEVYLYHTTLSPIAARAVFLDYLRGLNDLHQQPVFYNALTSNCTTNIRLHTAAAPGGSLPWNWRLLLNGKADEYVYQEGGLAGGLPFAVLKAAAHINDAARAAGQSPQFSDLIRRNRPGFSAN